jgi:hypothetical protein
MQAINCKDTDCECKYMDGKLLVSSRNARRLITTHVVVVVVVLFLLFRDVWANYLLILVLLGCVRYEDIF